MNWSYRETGGCHVAQKGETYPYGFDPTFYPHRLKEPMLYKRDGKFPPGIRVFVVDVGDLLGDWVPDKWIHDVLNIIRQHPQNIFQLLTKNPIKYHDFRLPDNVWIGTTIDSNVKARERYDALVGYNKSNVKKRFISFEPLFQDINMGNINNLQGIDWVIIGSDSRPSAAPAAKRPPIQRANNIIAQARNNSIPVFVKDHYGYPQVIKEFPPRGEGKPTMHVNELHATYKDNFQVDSVIRNQIRSNIEAKIKTDGYNGITPIDVWGNHIIMGHVRVEIAKEFGFKEVPVNKHTFMSENEALDYIEAKLPPSIKLIRPVRI